MKSRAEVKVVVASFALLVSLVVPVASAVVDPSTAAVETPAAAPATAGASFFLHGAPQPLLLMALGALVVAIPVTRRALRAGQPVQQADRR